MAKQVCLHTHINHVNEITWVTREAANRLFKHGVIVRNQSVLLNGVNDTKEDLSSLIETLASMNIQPVRTSLPSASRCLISISQNTFVSIRSASSRLWLTFTVLHLPMRHGTRH